MRIDQLMSRKTFIQSLGLAALAWLAVLWYHLAAKNRESGNNNEVKIPADVARGITLTDDCVVVRKDEEVKVFSARCTHAGCMITNLEGDILKCPCHGSEFDAWTGKPLKGPAYKPLKPFACRVDKKNGGWIIERD